MTASDATGKGPSAARSLEGEKQQGEAEESSRKILM